MADVFIPQDLDQPALKLDIDRVRARELGLSQKEVVSNVITALTSNQMIAPSLWIDPRNGNPYYLAVQYREKQVENLMDLRSIPLRGPASTQTTRLDMVSNIQRIEGPTEVDHFQIRRVIDVFVRPLGEDLSVIAKHIDELIAGSPIPKGVEVTLRGMVQSMRVSFRSFGIGLLLSVLLLYLILVAQFRSFVDPFIILLALPPGITGVLLTLWLTGTTLNVMSLMGVVMLAGVAMSNSILIVEFAHHLIDEGMRCRRSDRASLPRPAASGADDFAGHHHRADADGAETWRGKRGLCAAGEGSARRLDGIGDLHCVHRAGGLLPGVPEQGSIAAPDPPSYDCTAVGPRNPR